MRSDDGNLCLIVVGAGVSYHKDKLPLHPRTLFGGNERNSFHELICRSNRYMKSFCPDATVSWNILIKNIDDVSSFDILKDHLYYVLKSKVFSVFMIL